MWLSRALQPGPQAASQGQEEEERVMLAGNVRASDRPRGSGSPGHALTLASAQAQPSL
jgi:hypothetical protein